MPVFTFRINIRSVSNQHFWRLFLDDLHQIRLMEWSGFRTFALTSAPLGSQNFIS